MIVGVATVSANVTLSVKTVDFFKPPPIDVTVIGKLPAGVDGVVLMVSIVEQFKMQEVEEKEAVAPEGNPETPETLKEIA